MVIDLFLFFSFVLSAVIGFVYLCWLFYTPNETMFQMEEEILTQCEYCTCVFFVAKTEQAVQCPYCRCLLK